MKQRALLSPKDLQRIEAAVRAAEAKTSGEIVVVCLPACADYSGLTGRWGALGVVLATACFVLLSFTGHWPPIFWHLLEAQLIGLALGLALGCIPSLKRLLISRATASRNVHRECLASFTAAGLFETRDRTGILLALSLFERRVEILADRGIHAKLGPGYWRAQIERVVRGIREGRAADGVCEAVEQIGDELARHFPRKEDDTNELSDSVRLRPAEDE